MESRLNGASRWEAVEEVEKRRREVCRCWTVCVWEGGALGIDADHAPKNDNVLDQKWKYRHYPIIPHRLSEWHFSVQNGIQIV